MSGNTEPKLNDPLLYQALGIASGVMGLVLGTVNEMKYVSKEELMKYKRHLIRFMVLNIEYNGSITSAVLVHFPPNLLPKVSVLSGGEKIAPKDFDDTHDIVGNALVTVDKPTVDFVMDMFGNNLPVPKIDSFRAELFVLEKKTYVVDPSNLIIAIDSNKDKVKSITSTKDLFFVFYNDGTHDKFKVSGDPTPVIEYLNANFGLVKNSTCGRIWMRT